MAKFGTQGSNEDLDENFKFASSRNLLTLKSSSMIFMLVCFPVAKSKQLRLKFAENVLVQRTASEPNMPKCYLNLVFVGYRVPCQNFLSGAINRVSKRTEFML